MDCEKYIEIMMRELDGEATASETLELKGHLMTCERCRTLYETYRNIDAGVCAMEEDAPEGLSGAVMSAVRQEKEKQRPLYFLKRYKFTVAALAACLVLVVAGKGFGYGSDAAAEVDTSLARMETEAAVEEAAPAEAALPAPAEAPALMPAYDDATAETTEAVEDTATDETEEEVDDIAAVGAGELSGVLAALYQEQRTGDLVYLTGSAEDIISLFGTVYILDIPDGYRVYKVLREDFEAVVDQLSINAVVSTDPPGEDVYLYISE